MFKNAQEIKTAVDNGEIVYWINTLYTVIKDKNGKYLIKCGENYTGLTWLDGLTLNGELNEFITERDLKEQQAENKFRQKFKD